MSYPLTGPVESPVRRGGRAPASLRILRSSTASSGGRANSSFGMVDHHHGATLGTSNSTPPEERSTMGAGGITVGEHQDLAVAGLPGTEPSRRRRGGSDAGRR